MLKYLHDYSEQGRAFPSPLFTSHKIPLRLSLRPRTSSSENIIFNEVKAMSRRLRSIPDSKETPAQHPSKRKFSFLLRVYLSDTNAQGNVYFARFFDWQGRAREEFLRAAVPGHQALFLAGLRLLTSEASAEYKGEARLYDEIEVAIHVPWIKRASFQLGFTFIHTKTGEILDVGRQVIACSNSGGKLVAIPQEIKNALLPLKSA